MGKIPVHKEVNRLPITFENENVVNYLPLIEEEVFSANFDKFLDLLMKLVYNKQ